MPVRRDRFPSHFVPRSEAWSVEFVRRLASLATATPFGTGWLIERRTDLPGIAVVPGDSVAAEVAQAAASGLPGRLGPAPQEALGVPESRDRFAVVARRGWGIAGAESDEPVGHPTGPSSPRPAGPEVPLDLRPALGAVQCHWFSTGRGRLACRIRYWSRAGPEHPVGEPAALAASAIERLQSEGVPAEIREVANTFRRRRAWTSGAVGSFRVGPLERLRSSAASGIALGVPVPVRVDDTALARHVVVVGASGSGKSTWLAQVAAERVERGASVVAFDLHGDLGPAIAARLTPSGRRRLVAVDAASSPDRIPGVRLLQATTPKDREREAAHLVAALKRLTGESGDVYWGYRLERTFDTFVRLVQEEGGGLRDLYELLTDARRRDAARLTTRQPAVASFLDELPALLRRNAEYLAPAAGRVAKVALSPTVVRLLDPAGPGLSVLELLREGRSIVWRLPFAEIGPESSTFAATLLASHAYLALAAEGAPAAGPGVVFVLDEGSAISPRLAAEMLAEGRKFGVGVVLATQYPGRLAPEARAAAEGAAGTHLVFRVPSPVAGTTAEWAGLARSCAPLLEALPDGVAIVSRSGDGGGRGTLSVPPAGSDDGESWSWCVDATSTGWEDDRRPGPSGEPATVSESLLLALAAGPAEGASVVRRAGEIAGGATDPAAVAATLETLVVRRWVDRRDGRYDLTEAGARFLGVGRETGAARESAQHRALLFGAFAILAKRGARLEFVRQGRFDRRLPDGVVRLLPAPNGRSVPEELARRVDASRRSWAWRYFGGRDVDVEAEVSGALRPDRIRRNLEKSQRRGTFALFLVAEPGKARRIRSVLSEDGVDRRTATVWTIRAAEAAPVQVPEAAGSGGGEPEAAAGRATRGASPADRWSSSSTTA
jgi:DNA helicase HerA-like ATPase